MFQDKQLGSNQRTERNFFRSLPDAISRRIAKPLLISILSAAATCRTGSSGIWTSGKRGGDLNRNNWGVKQSTKTMGKTMDVTITEKFGNTFPIDVTINEKFGNILVNEG